MTLNQTAPLMVYASAPLGFLLGTPHPHPFTAKILFYLIQRDGMGRVVGAGAQDGEHLYTHG